MTTETTPDGSLLEGPAKERYVTGMFDRIASPYDRLNRIISLGRDETWRRRALAWAGVGPGDRAADLGCGTGDLYLLLRERVTDSGSVVGIDASAGMLDVARAKAARRRPDETPQLRMGRAEETGLPDAGTDVVTMGWVLRNVADRTAVYREVLRVLAPGGRFLCLDMSRPALAPLRWGSRLYLHGIMPVLVRCFGGDLEAYRYLCRSTDRFPGREELAEEWRAAGFSDVEHRGLMMGSIGVHLGRKR